MPVRPLKACGHPSCKRLVKNGYCEQHQRPAWQKRNDSPKRITGRRLQAMRRELFNQQPLCQLCLAEGRTTVAVERDHIVALSQGGADDVANTQSICASCHDKKSLEERISGRMVNLNK